MGEQTKLEEEKKKREAEEKAKLEEEKKNNEAEEQARLEVERKKKESEEEPAPVHMPAKEPTPELKEVIPETVREEELVEIIGSISNAEPELEESTPAPASKESTPEPKEAPPESKEISKETSPEELRNLAEEIIAADQEHVKENIEDISEPTEVNQGAKGLKDLMDKTIPDTDKVENGFTHITEDDVEIIGAVEDESKLE